MSESPRADGRPRRLATAALVLAVLPVPLTWIPALALGIVVLYLASKGLEGGRGMATAAVVVSSSWIVVSIVAGTVVSVVTADPDTSDAVDSPSVPGFTDVRPGGGVLGDVVIDDLAKGDCIQSLPEDDEPDTVVLVKCSVEHEAEVYALFDLAPQRAPSQDDIDRLADGGCTRRFDDFVGMDYSDSHYDYSWFDPTPDGLESDPTVICVIVDPDGPTTGSLGGVQG